MDAHNDRVARVVERMRSFHQRKVPYRIYHGTTNTTRRTKLDRQTVIDTSAMNQVLKIDRERRTALVEPNVSMARLVDATIEHGLVPLVVMEFPAITVGGGFSGTAFESTSFRHGLFDRTINYIEIVLADGEVVQASPNLRSDLFNTAAGTFGSFGVITKLEVQCTEAKPYVHLTYTPVNGVEEAVNVTEELTQNQEVEYLEGILFGPHKGVMISGMLTENSAPQLPVARFTRPWDPWFYLHAEHMLESRSTPVQEMVPIRDYFFRYDRGAFWMGKYAFEYFVTPFNSITRWLLDGFMKTDVMYHALHKSHLSDQFIIQDIRFPYATVGPFIDYLHQNFGFYPLWLCPLKLTKDSSLHPHDGSIFSQQARGSGYMMNVGLWGPGPKRHDHSVQANRDIERITRSLGGLKLFYAPAFYTEEEFWELYDKKHYDSVRQKYKAADLRPVYEKVNVKPRAQVLRWDRSWKQWAYEIVKEQWPVRGIYGVLQTFTGTEYLLA